MLTQKQRELLERRRKQVNDNKAQSVRKLSEYSDHITNYISSAEELHYYQALGLEEAYITRYALIRSIDFNMPDVFGRTNRERISDGLSPVAFAGTQISFTLHHIGQKFTSPFAELIREIEHAQSEEFSFLHPNGCKKGWRNERTTTEFDIQRREYWQRRVELDV